MAGTGFWWVIFAMVLYGVLHSILASHTIKRFAKQLLGVEVCRYYRLFFNTVVVITLFPVLALVLLLPDRLIYGIPFPWLILSLLIQFVAGFGVLHGVMQTDAWHFLGFTQLKAAEPEEQSGQLVISGLYRWVRHPLYTLGMIFIWLMPLMSWNMLAFNIAASVYMVLGAVLEERKLLDAFGDVYAEYKRKTPMLIPGLKQKR